MFEHVATAQAAEFVSGDDNLARPLPASLIIVGRFWLGYKTHYYCLPVVKKPQKSLAKGRRSDKGKVFLGFGEVLHIDAAKLQPCGYAGIFNAKIRCYLLLFRKINAG